jgi:predicted HTH domain antitoxin
MAVKVTLDLPPDVEERLRRETPNLDADVKEAYALELFRQGRLSHCELSRVLGLDRFETDAYLKQHNVFEGSLSMADLEADRQTLDRVMGKTRRWPSSVPPEPRW